MNKLKLIYDVAKAMKEKEVFIGTLEVEAQKDQISCFTLKNDFEKNLVSGQVKVKINTALDCEGKQVKHESTSEFNLQHCCGGKNHHRHLRGHFHSHCCSEESDCCTESNSCCGLKGKLAAFGYILRLIDKTNVDELDNNVIALSLTIDEIPVELLQHVHGRLNHCCPPDHECCGMNNLKTLEKPVIDVNALLNADRAIEKIVVKASGTARDKDDQRHEMNFRAELNLKW